MSAVLAASELLRFRLRLSKIERLTAPAYLPPN